MKDITAFINSFTFDDERFPSIIQDIQTLTPSFEAAVLSNKNDTSVIEYIIDKLSHIGDCITMNLQNALKLSKDYDADMTHLTNVYAQLNSIVNTELAFCKRFIKCEEHQQKSNPEAIVESPISHTLYKRLHDLYGDTITATQLSSFFKVHKRTIKNWENSGFIENISEKSDEYKPNGQKKRGKSKLYLTSEVAQNIELQRKFNKL